ncbi:MAG: hypothetical protein II458_03910 [Oscillospiraceae bacterium]|nr:hypothetical protein [Oscillospiraceae bacterium]
MDKMILTRGNPQEEAPKRVEKKPNKKLRIALILLAVLVLLGVLVSVLWDANSFDGLRRSVIYSHAEKDGNGCAMLYGYGGDRSARFAALDGSLLIASPTQIRLIGENGAVRFEESVRFQNCTVVKCGSRAAVCDVGGTDVYVMDSHGLTRHMEMPGQILAASMSEKGCLTVTVNDSGYKASVKVYDENGAPAFDFHSADRFLMAASLSRDGRTMMAVTLGESDGVFANRLVTYRLTGTQPLNKVDLTGGAVYDVGVVGRRFCAVSEDALYFLTASGALTETYDFDGATLRRCSLDGDGYAALLLGHYKTGSRCRLVTVNEDGRPVAELEVDGDVVDLSVSGRYVAVLYSDHLTIYDKTLRQLATLKEVSTVRQVLMRNDGSAVLAGLTSASLYLP